MRSQHYGVSGSSGRGEPGEQWTMFLHDPAGNTLEFKAFADDSQVFATSRRRYPRCADHWPWTDLITGPIERLQLLQNLG